MIKKLILLILVAFVSNTSAEVYTWIDENGVKHFGDKIPEKYQQQAKDVKINTRQPTPEEVEAASDRIKRMKSVRLPGAQHSNKREVRRKQTKKKEYNSEYERQMAEYRESQACFAKCSKRNSPHSRHVRTPDGGLQYIPGNAGLDNSACGHCKSVTLPEKR